MFPGLFILACHVIFFVIVITLFLGCFATACLVIFFVIAVTLFPGLLTRLSCDFLHDCNRTVSGALKNRLSAIFSVIAVMHVSEAESGSEEVSASHRNRDCAALLDIGSARCPESSIHMGKAFEIRGRGI